MDWKKQEIQMLKKLLEDGKTLRECSAFLGRTYTSVEHKSRELKFKRPEPQIIVPDGKLRLPNKMKREDHLSLIQQLMPEIIAELRKNVFHLNPYPGISKTSREEESVLILSDMHTGMENSIYDPQTQAKIITFNEDIRQREMYYLRDSIFEIHDILSAAYKLRKLHIFILGDMITNDRIFNGQTFEIDRPYGKQMWDTCRDLVFFINEMKKKYDEIHVIGVVGNHGRSNPTMYDEPVENNFEWTMYRIIQEAFAGDKRVKMEVPNTRFYSTEIYGHTYYMSHGDNLRGFSRAAVDKAAKDLLTTLMTDLPEGFDAYCFDDKTSLLTRDGWKKYNEVDTHTQYATINPKTKQLEYHKAENLFILDYDGDMVHSKTDQMDMCITPDHRVVTFPAGVTNPAGEYKFTVGAKLLGTQRAIPTSIETVGLSELVYKEHLKALPLLAWYLTEGSDHTGDGSGGITVSQTFRKTDYIHDIISAFDLAEVTYTSRTFKPSSGKIVGNYEGITFYISKEQADKLRQEHSFKKGTIPEWVFSMPAVEIEKFLYELVKGDGTKQKDIHWVFYTSDKEFADQVQLLCFLSGWRAVINSRNHGINNTLMYELSMTKRPTCIIAAGSTKVEHYKGKVWDVTVPNHILVAKRDGAPFITGNCIGHFHASEKLDINEKSTVIVNGSWIPRDQYGYRMFRRYSKPQQWFFGVSKNRAITWSYALDLKGLAHSKRR